MRPPWPPQFKKGFWGLLPGKNPSKFLFLKLNPLGGNIIAQLSQKCKGSSLWVSRPQRGDIQYRPLPGSLGSGPLASTGGQPLAAAPPPAPPTPGEFSPPESNPGDRSPVPPWSI